MSKETKNKILKALEGKKIMCCPFCKHEYFIRRTYDRIQIIDDGECMTDEAIELNYEDCVYICQSCGEDVTEEEFIR